MRAAAKVAGIGVFNSGLRAEHPVTAAARKAARPIASGVSADDVKLVASFQDDNNCTNKIEQSVQRPFWDMDDWEFAGAEDELFLAPVEPMPRHLFGGAPSLEEAKAATSELKDALEKAYLSPSTDNGLADSFTSNKESVEESDSFLSDSENIETKPIITSEAAVTYLAPKHAMQAFRFLNESPAAQTVVASIASDPNVWFAVLQNKELLDYIESQKKSTVALEDIDASVNGSVADAESPNSSDESHKGSEFGGGIMDYLEHIRVQVVDMMNSLSDTLLNFFGGPMGGESSANADGGGKATFVDKALGASFMGLAVMVIMVVVLKRG